MIQVDDLGKTFPDGTRALDHVSLRIKPGEFSVVLGPSGSGKTTFLRSLNGLTPISEGKVLVDQIPLGPNSKRAIRLVVGMIFQNFNLVGNLSAINNVLTGLLFETSALRSLTYRFSRQQKLKALAVLDQVGLLEKAYTRADRLSGGQQQRIGIARAIVREPKIILADEPVASLDPVIAFNVLSTLREICKNNGITVVCNLHQVDLALRFADRIIGLNSGKLLFNETIQKIDKDYLQSVYGEGSRGLFFSPGRQLASLPDAAPAAI